LDGNLGEPADGKISREEFVEFVRGIKETISTSWSNIDTDGNGVITAKEATRADFGGFTKIFFLNGMGKLWKYFVAQDGDSSSLSIEDVSIGNDKFILLADCHLFNPMPTFDGEEGSKVVPDQHAAGVDYARFIHFLKNVQQIDQPIDEESVTTLLDGNLGEPADGKISREEFVAFVHGIKETVSTSWSYIDTDGNGVISAKEATKAKGFFVNKEPQLEKGMGKLWEYFVAQDGDSSSLSIKDVSIGLDKFILLADCHLFKPQPAADGEGEEGTSEGTDGVGEEEESEVFQFKTSGKDLKLKISVETVVSME